jgi:prepilin-type N-terminal cleavage/methylation domain-containing protein
MSRRGFTLIELAITLSVVVVLSSVLVLRISGWTPAQSLRASARTVGNAVRTWRERARLEERNYRLRFEEQGWEVLDAGGEPLARGRLPGGHALAAAETLTFTPRGVVPPTRLVLSNASGTRIDIDVHPVLNEIEYREAR